MIEVSCSLMVSVTEKGLRVEFWIFKRDHPLDVVGIHLLESLDPMQLVAMHVTGGIEPRPLIDVLGIHHHHRIALPLADGGPEPP